MNFKPYRRKQIAELADWLPGFDMAGVSVSEADKAAGSPKPGDKIARNPANHADKWLREAEAKIIQHLWSDTPPHERPADLVADLIERHDYWQKKAEATKA